MTKQLENKPSTASKGSVLTLEDPFVTCQIHLFAWRQPLILVLYTYLGKPKEWQFVLIPQPLKKPGEFFFQDICSTSRMATSGL